MLIPNGQAEAFVKLQTAFPLLRFNKDDTLLIQRRRCVACTKVSYFLRDIVCIPLFDQFAPVRLTILAAMNLHMPTVTS